MMVNKCIKAWVIELGAFLVPAIFAFMAGYTKEYSIIGITLIFCIILARANVRNSQ